MDVVSPYVNPSDDYVPSREGRVYTQMIHNKQNTAIQYLFKESLSKALSCTVFKEHRYDRTFSS